MVERVWTRNYFNGLKILFKRTSENRSFDNDNDNVIKKYKKILDCLTREQISIIGSKEKSFELTFYVDGTVSAYLS